MKLTRHARDFSFNVDYTLVSYILHHCTGNQNEDKGVRQ